jgi:hypothetical protein
VADRISPLGGYSFGNKAQYRRTVWNQFRLFLNGQCHDKQALLMPSIEGLEIDVAINNGFRQCNLHIVDNNPAIVATLKRKYPYINTYGVSVNHAIERIAKKCIRLSCANFDFTGPVFTDKQMNNIIHCTHPYVFTDRNIIAVTALCGRDDPKILAWNSASLKSSDRSLYSHIPGITSEVIAVRAIGIAGLTENYMATDIHGNNIGCKRLSFTDINRVIKYRSTSKQDFISVICTRSRIDKIVDTTSIIDIPAIRMCEISRLAKKQRTARGELIFK